MANDDDGLEGLDGHTHLDTIASRNDERAALHTEPGAVVGDVQRGQILQCSSSRM